MISKKFIELKFKRFSLATFMTLVFLGVNIYGCEKAPELVLLHGDIVFQTAQTEQSLAIQLATKSPYTHVGVVTLARNGDVFIYEAIGPVARTPLKKWIKSGKDNMYVVKRLKNSDEVFKDKASVQAIREAALKYMEQPYDIYFGWDDERIYCSEFVYKTFKDALGIELGELAKLGSFDLTHPEVKKVLAERYGDKVPLNEPVISPAAMFASDKLELIFTNYK